MKICFFSKGLQDHAIAEAGRIIRDLGFDGVDLTVRPGGHVEPDHVAEQLPEAVDTLRQIGLEVPMLTTNVSDADDPTARPIFQTAAAQGITELKLGYWKYRDFGTFHDQFAAADRKLTGLADLAGEIGVRVNIHNHSGQFMTAHAGTIWQWLCQRDANHVGAYIDPMHFMIEGLGRGWEQAMDQLAPRTNLVAIKDFQFDTTQTDERTGRPKYQWRNVPITGGLMPWPTVFDYLRQIGYDGWLSLHCDWWTHPVAESLSFKQKLAETSEELVYLRELSG